ncbi:HAD family hydrolase [Candidatus Woesearchaeota archaeon]|nr:HAD family hydrolase [Candidatus Woesearchaeota archaeon]
MIKLLIFDYDGVLFDTKKIAFSLIRDCCRKFLKKEIDEKEFIDIYKSNFYESMLKRGVSRKTLEEIKEYAEKVLEKKQLHVHSGVKSAAKKLSKTHTLAVISSNYDDVMRKNLKKAGILQNFHYILGTEEGENKKKKIQNLLKQTKASKPEAVFITDTVGDIKEAKKSGIKTMAVTWGFHSKKLLEKANPDFIAEKTGRIIEELA